MRRIDRNSPDFAIIIGSLTIILNIVLIGLGIWYYALPVYNVLWDVQGACLIVTYIWNVIAVLGNKRLINRDTTIGRQLSGFSYIYLVFFVVLTFLAMFGNFLVSTSSPDREADYQFAFALILAGYFGTTGLGTILGFLIRSNATATKHGDGSTFTTRVPSKRVLFIRRLNFFSMKATAYILLIGTGPLMIYFLFAKPYDLTTLMFGVFIAQLIPFLGFTYLGLTAILLRTKDRKKNKVAFPVIAVAGIVISGACFLPMLATPIMVVNAGNSFAAAFGAGWQARIDPAANSHFMQTPFSLPEYFLNNIISNYQVKQDILFYNSTSGNDKGITLYFDAYLPPRGATGLPGHNSTLVRIHGGAWQIGDKGRGNMVQMNRYFAAQGYIVFDIQYGMRSGGWELPIITPPNVLAPNITTDDMMREVGAFCKYIEANQSIYQCNLSSVFISGGSAGGQITCATALALAAGNYTAEFGTGITVKGLIPFYPANGLAQPPIEGALHQFWDPTFMVNDTSPPCLIFQGTNDLPQIQDASARFKAAYDAHGRQCAIISAPLAGHGNDLDFTTYYNLVFLYYMERFMYMFK
ncbi:MAG TPA: alpha/beta hydrolase fold domain-containing protein [Candidatus Lokiarchaeia archaeon]|nr:alpha/beta hydrolase fold domain-containing protein [Candidatus Lokiarchaeia archaeon]